MTLYLYAIVDAPLAGPLGKGLGGGELAIARVGRTQVVVEEVDSADEEAAAPTLASIVAHDRVVRRIARAVRRGAGDRSALLPLRFGSTARHRGALTKLLSPRSREIAIALDRVRGAVQFTLRISGRPAPPPKLPRQVGAGTRFLVTRVHAQRLPEIAPLTEATRPFVREVRIERKGPPPQLARAYHLVAHDDVRRWRAAVRATTHELRVEVTVTGPWPPYAFTELE